MHLSICYFFSNYKVTEIKNYSINLLYLIKEKKTLPFMFIICKTNSILCKEYFLGKNMFLYQGWGSEFKGDLGNELKDKNGLFRTIIKFRK